MKLDDFSTADKFSAILTNTIPDEKGSKYYRGTLGTMNGNMSDVYLFNSSTPIKNVPVGNGLTNLFENEDVYVLAINGNLNNAVIDKRVIDYNLLFGFEVENYRLSEDFFDVLNWSEGQDLALFYKDYEKVKYKTFGINVQCSSYDTYAFKIQNLTEDFSCFHDDSESNDSDYVFLSAYFSDVSKVISVNIVCITTESSDFYYYTDYAYLENGWNLVKIMKSAFTVNGSPDWSSIIEIDIGVNPSELPTASDIWTFGCIGIYRAAATYINGHKVIVSDTVPATPSEGDLWFDIS